MFVLFFLVEALLDSSHERKFLVYKIIEMIIPKINDDDDQVHVVVNMVITHVFNYTLRTKYCVFHELKYIYSSEFI